MLKRLVAASLFAVIGLLNFGPAQAVDVTNLDEKVKDLLMKRGRVPYTHKVEQPVHLKRNCGIIQPCDYVRVVKRTEQVYLTASNYKMSVKGETKFNSRKDTPLKADQEVLSQHFRNCDLVKDGTMALAISTAVAHTITATLTKQAALAEGGSFGISGGIPGFATLSGSLTITKTDTKMDAKADALAKTDTRSTTDTKTVGPMTLMTAFFILWPIKSEIPFHVTATIDADLSGNDKGWMHLSDIYSVDDRKFPIDGIITVTQASDGDVEFKPKPLTPAECSAPEVANQFTVDPLTLFTLSTKGTLVQGIPTSPAIANEPATQPTVQ